jgi:PAS domain S-box-containing protein
MPRSEDWIARLDDALARPPQEAPAAVRALFAELTDEQARLAERLAMISAASFEGLFYHVDGVVIDVNERMCEMHGYTRAEMLAPDLLRRCVAPEDVPEVIRRMVERYEGVYVATGIRKDGTRMRVEVQAKQGHLGDRPVRVIALRDVTERERTHALLRESEARFRELADGAFDLTVFSRDGIIVDIRGAVERVLGRHPSEMVGRPVFDFMAPSAVPGAQQMIEQNRLGYIDIMAVHASGELVPTHATVVASTLDGLPVRVSGVRDLRPALRLQAERRALEERVQRAQRLDSLGVLAGGIAHDFNNLLTGILGNAEFLRDRLTEGEDLEAARAIAAATQRAAGLTRQMLAYAGQRDLARRREPVDVGDLVRELRALIDASLSKKAELTLSIAPGSVALGDHATLVQVFMNLLTNASDALGDRPGRISIRARPVSEVDARWDAAQGASVRPGSWVLIEVRDDGVGMDEATRGRVFEPFFSTKEKGQGLGLAACLGVVAAHGGAVLVESELGEGSCFSVLLPASAGSERAAEQRPAAAARPCRVLVVDDEAVVRAQLRRSLELRGYTVDEARNGREALAALAPSGAGAQPDVVILDMTMPDIDGAEVLRRVRAEGSRVPIVVSSGYLDVAIQRRLPRGGFQGFLPKPYGATDLVDAIERARAPHPDAETS